MLNMTYLTAVCKIEISFLHLVYSIFTELYLSSLHAFVTHPEEGTVLRGLNMLPWYLWFSSPLMNSCVRRTLISTDKAALYNSVTPTWNFAAVSDYHSAIGRPCACGGTGRAKWVTVRRTVHRNKGWSKFMVFWDTAPYSFVDGVWGTCLQFITAINISVIVSC